MNIVIDIEKDFLTGIKKVRAEIKIANYKYAVIAYLNNKPFYMSENLYTKKIIWQLKKDIENYLSKKLNPIP